MSYSYSLDGFHGWATTADPLPKAAESLPRATESQLITVCSYCDRVQVAGTQEPEWISMKQCYERIGDGPFQLTHGICPKCYQRVVEPLLLKLRRRAATPITLDPVLTTA